VDETIDRIDIWLARDDLETLSDSTNCTKLKEWLKTLEQPKPKRVSSLLLGHYLKHREQTIEKFEIP
jgi:hypothetical protein